MSSFTGMSCAQLFKKIGTSDAPRIIDTRLAEDYARDTALIPSSRRISHQIILNTLPDKAQDPPIGKTVVVCQQGHKISNGTAAVLRAQGVPEEVLSGGFCAWHEQGLPLVSLQA
ncbi:MAG: sulfurtransferase, partial [Rhodobacteraceae bacterium]|nr:sulfurtransferase [Paracoccaceae bacterium]